MAINLASKYSDQIAEVFTRASFIKGKTAETYDLTGVKTLKVYTPITVEEVDYDRDGGLKRYGDVTEMQDVVQELTMTQDKAFTLTIDKGNNLDQNLVKNAADMLRLQLNEKSTPAADKYAFKRFVTMAGSIVESAKPTKANIISKIADASQALDDALVPDDNRYLYLTSEMYKLVCTSDEFAGVDVLARQSIAKGVCGEVFGMNVVRVPKSYLPEDVYFLVAHKDAVLMPYKIADAKVHEDPVGVSGALIEAVTTTTHMCSAQSAAACMHWSMRTAARAHRPSARARLPRSARCATPWTARIRATRIPQRITLPAPC